MENRVQLLRVSSLLRCEFQGRDSGCQARQCIPYPLNHFLAPRIVTSMEFRYRTHFSDSIHEGHSALSDHLFLSQKQLGWRDGPLVERACRGPKLDSQAPQQMTHNPCNSSSLSATLSDLLGCTHSRMYISLSSLSPSRQVYH